MFFKLLIDCIKCIFNVLQIYISLTGCHDSLDVYWQKNVADICQKLAPLVDKGYFCTKDILIELLEYVSWGIGGETEPSLDMKHFGTDLVTMMFGQSSRKLAQLASRAFIDCKFVGNTFGKLSSSEVIHNFGKKLWPSN